MLPLRINSLPDIKIMSSFETIEHFELPVTYNGEVIVFPSRLVRRGYSYAIYVTVYGNEVIFEPDEERNFRAIVDNPSDSSIKREILQAITEALEKNLR